jgi:acyl-CoA thioesterase FadM
VVLCLCFSVACPHLTKRFEFMEGTSSSEGAFTLWLDVFSLENNALAHIGTHRLLRFLEVARVEAISQNFIHLLDLLKDGNRIVVRCVPCSSPLLLYSTPLNLTTHSTSPPPPPSPLLSLPLAIISVHRGQNFQMESTSPSTTLLAPTKLLIRMKPFPHSKRSIKIGAEILVPTPAFLLMSSKGALLPSSSFFLSFLHSFVANLPCCPCSCSSCSSASDQMVNFAKMNTSIEATKKALSENQPLTLVAQSSVTLVCIDPSGRASDLPSWFTSASPSALAFPSPSSSSQYPNPSPRKDSPILTTVHRKIAFSDLDWNGHVNHGLGFLLFILLPLCTPAFCLPF